MSKGKVAVAYLIMSAAGLFGVGPDCSQLDNALSYPIGFKIGKQYENHP